MPMNGEINTDFGVYKSLCCEAEIVIPSGAAFPDCPNHSRLTTVWRSLRDENIPHESETADEVLPILRTEKRAS
jgi:hypothetical protein